MADASVPEHDSIGEYFADPTWPLLLANRDALTLGRCLTLIESGLASSSYLLARAGLGGMRGRTLGLTGPPGAGKSTLIGGLIATVRSRGESVAVLAVDPSSPHSGGALLGDRLRMGMGCDDGLFIRSLASRGHLGGTASCARDAIDLLASLFQNVIVETVGAGQSDVEIRKLVQTCIVVCVPGLGDDVQMGKAGILEIADILVVNQADKAGSAETVRQLQQIFRGKRVLETVATQRQGIEDLFDACVEAGSVTSTPPLNAVAARRAIESELAQALLQHFAEKAGSERWQEAIVQVRAGKDPGRAAEDILRHITS